MQITLLHQQLLLQTEKLRDLHRSMMIHTGSVSAIEMENLLQEIRKLYGIALQLSNENSIQLLNDVQMAINVSTRIQNNHLHEPVQENNPVATIPPVKKAEHVIHEEPVAQYQPENIQEKISSVTDIHERFHEAPTVAGRFEEKQTVANKIAGTETTKRLSDNLKSPVRDLKNAIGINEKFQFINHLFGGDARKYNSVLDEINSAPSSETALKNIQSISEKYNWDHHPLSARNFLEFIERRFSA
jgi:hypothetical protein